ncbi:alpha/beta fold hydrolase [Specibacter sp. NPDC057265]|uniref:alpha/beta fold hydrolase n=1 Tax=Specibacter sp. NPDC057265 TaxID=3346075 RepID=UPI003632C945
MADPVVSTVHAHGLTGRVYASARGPREARTPGSHDGVAYVLIHGIGVSHRYLARLHSVLARGSATYSIDLPGFAGTPKPPRQLSIADYADFILAVLAQLEVGPCVLVGHSMGAQFVLEAALQRPALVARLVLMGPVTDVRRRNPLRQGWDLALDSVIAETPKANWMVFSDYWRCGPRWYLRELPVMLGYPIEDRITALTVPVLVLRGVRDTVASHPWCAQLASLAPAGRLQEVPGCGHVVQHKAPEEVAAAIEAFVASPPTPLEATA